MHSSYKSKHFYCVQCHKMGLLVICVCLYAFVGIFCHDTWHFLEQSICESNPCRAGLVVPVSDQFLLGTASRNQGTSVWKENATLLVKCNYLMTLYLHCDLRTLWLIFLLAP